MAIFALVSFLLHPIQFLRDWRASKSDSKDAFELARDYAQQPVARRVKPRVRPADELPKPPSPPKSQS